MSADIRQVLRVIDLRGIDLRVDDGRLVARARSGPVPEDMVRFIGHFKDMLLAELEQSPGSVQPAAPPDP
jgi:hypothetical protein